MPMTGPEVHIDVALQQLHLMLDGATLRTYPVSTALNGVGEHNGSGCTPRGLHRVRAKVGAGCAPGTVFVGRRATGEIYSPALAAEHPGRDWILSRILWLTGCEPGFTGAARWTRCAATSTSTAARTTAPWACRGRTAACA